MFWVKFVNNSVSFKPGTGQVFEVRWFSWRALSGEAFQCCLAEDWHPTASPLKFNRESRGMPALRLLAGATRLPCLLWICCSASGLVSEAMAENYCSDFASLASGFQILGAMRERADACGYSWPGYKGVQAGDPSSLGVTKGSAEENPAGADPRWQLGTRPMRCFLLKLGSQTGAKDTKCRVSMYMPLCNCSQCWLPKDLCPVCLSLVSKSCRSKRAWAVPGGIPAELLLELPPPRGRIFV